MLKDIVEVRVKDEWCLTVRFEDGVAGDVDVAELVEFAGVFAVLADPARFRAVRVDPESGTVCWPGGADLDPDVLYAKVTGTAIELPEHQASRT